MLKGWKQAFGQPRRIRRSRRRSQAKNLQLSEARSSKIGGLKLVLIHPWNCILYEYLAVNIPVVENLQVIQVSTAGSRITLAKLFNRHNRRKELSRSWFVRNVLNPGILRERVLLFFCIFAYPVESLSAFLPSTTTISLRD